MEPPAAENRHMSRLERFICVRERGGAPRDSRTVYGGEVVAPYPITNEAAALLVLITASGTLVMLAFLGVSWMEDRPRAFAAIGLGTGFMLGALVLASINMALRCATRANPSPDPAALRRRYGALDWLEWLTIIFTTGLVTVAANIALPAFAAMLRAAP